MAYICQEEITIWDKNVIDLPNGWGIRRGGVALVLIFSSTLFYTAVN